MDPFKRIAAISNLSDFTDSQATKDPRSWNKSNKKLSPNFLTLGCGFNEKDEFEKSKSSNSNTNSSTLSLHIAAYENSVEATNDSDVEENEGNKGGTTDPFKKWKTAKQFFSGSASIIQVAFNIIQGMPFNQKFTESFRVSKAAGRGESK